MGIRFACPACGHELTFASELKGAMRPCTQCGADLLVWPVGTASATVPAERARLGRQLRVIGEDELANARAGLALARADSRFGATGQAMGSRRGGLFNAPLIRFKIGQLEDVLYRQLPAE